MGAATTPATADRPVPAICCRGLVVRYGDLTAVDHLDLEVHRGECFGLLGPNGAGKTTAVEAFEGLIAPAAGEIELLGQRWGTRSDRALRQRIGAALQETRLSETLTVRETVRLFRSFYDRGREVDEVVELLGLVEKRKARVGKLSGGQRQRLSLACALVGQPDVLFLDEPTTGLDPQARLRIWEVIERFRDRGGTVLLTTHYMEEAARLCGRVAIIDQGKRIALDTPEALLELLGADEIIEVDAGPAVEELETLPGTRRVEQRGGRVALLVEDINDTLPALLALAADRGATLGSIATHRATLEDVFVHLTGRGLRDG